MDFNLMVNVPDMDSQKVDIQKSMSVYDNHFFQVMRLSFIDRKEKRHRKKNKRFDIVMRISAKNHGSG
jgi:hypothetical protein